MVLFFERKGKQDILFSVLVRCIEKISSRIDHIQALSAKYDFLIASNLQNEKYECHVDDIDENIQEEEIFLS